MNIKTWAWAISLCLALACASHPRQRPDPSQPPAERSSAMRSPAPRPASIRRSCRDLYSRIVTSQHLRRAVRVRLPRAPGEDPAEPRRRPCPRSSADFRTYTVQLKRGIYFADDPAFGGKKREVTAHDVVYTLQALLRPEEQEPAAIEHARGERILGLDELRKKRARRTGKFDYDTRGRGPAGARPLHRAVQAGRAAAALHLRPRRPGIVGIVAREVVEKYGDADHGAPGRHGPLHAGRLEALLQDHAGAQPELPRGALRGRARGRRRQAQEIYAQLQGQAPADGRQGRGLDHRGAAAALARVPEQRAGLHGAPAGELRHAGDPERQARAQPGQARHPAWTQCRCRTSPCSTST